MSPYVGFANKSLSCGGEGGGGEEGGEGGGVGRESVYMQEQYDTQSYIWLIHECSSSSAYF